MKKVLLFPLKIHEWIQSSGLNPQTKYRIQKLILTALAANTNQFLLTKSQFESLIETTNRRTQKEFIELLKNQNIITILREDHFQLQFEISSELFEDDSCMSKTGQIALKFESSDAYQPPGLIAQEENMIEQFTDHISDLLAEVSSKENLERMAKSEAVKKTLYDRLAALRQRIKKYEKRSGKNLSKETSSLDAIKNIVDAIQVFDPAPKTFDEKKKHNKIKMTPKSVVAKFYAKLSEHTGIFFESIEWPSEIQAAKDILRQLSDREPAFILAYIDWSIKSIAGIKGLYNLRYHVPRYLQWIEDLKHWKPIWTEYKKRTTNEQGFIQPENEEELVCLFVDLHDRTFDSTYKPMNSFQKDSHNIKQIMLYLGDDLERTAEFIRWCLTEILPAHKIKPAGPGELYRFIAEFKRLNEKIVETKPAPTTPANNALRLGKIFHKIKDRQPIALNSKEKQVIEFLLKNTQIRDLEEDAQQFIQKNPNTFTVSGQMVSLK